jgi:hypothetical protein
MVGGPDLIPLDMGELAFYDIRPKPGFVQDRTG